MITSYDNDNPIAKAMRAHLKKYEWDNSLNQQAHVPKYEPKLVAVGEINGNDSER